MEIFMTIKKRKNKQNRKQGHCRYCLESDCAVELDGQCEMVRDYLKNRSFHYKISLLLNIDGAKKTDLFDAVYAEWRKTLPVILAENKAE